MEPIAKEIATGITLSVHVLPGSSRHQIVGVHEQKLKVKIAAKSVEGAANKALRNFLALHFGVSRSAVTLLKGEHSRDKLIGIAGDAKALMRCLQPLLNEGQGT